MQIYFDKRKFLHNKTVQLPHTNMSADLMRRFLRWLNTVLAVREYMSFAKSWQEKGYSSQAETWQVKNILIKDFD